MDSGLGTGVSTVASNIRRPRFESSHQQILFNIYLLLTVCKKTKIKKKRSGMDFKKIDAFFPQHWSQSSVTRCWSKKQTNFGQKLPIKYPHQFNVKISMSKTSPKLFLNIRATFARNFVPKIAQSGHTVPVENILIRALNFMSHKSPKLKPKSVHDFTIPFTFLFFRL